MVEPGTGLVKAMVQSKPYGDGRNQTTYNYNVEKSYAGGYGGFQNGSTMKAFTIAAAIQKGIPIDYQINSPPQIDLSGKKFTTCTGRTRDLDYQPKNSTTSGDLTMVDAARFSTNTYFLQLSEQTGLCPIATDRVPLGHVQRADRRAARPGRVDDARGRLCDAADAVERVRDVRRPWHVLQAATRHPIRTTAASRSTTPGVELQAGPPRVSPTASTGCSVP